MIDTIEVDKSLSSLALERRALAGLLKYPDIYWDIQQYVSDKDFVDNVHEVIFFVLKSAIENKEEIDRVLIGKKINDLGIRFKNNLNVHEYLEALELSQITENGTKKTFVELFDLRVRRDVFDKAKSVCDYIINNKTEKLDSVITNCDNIYNSAISQYIDSDEPINVFDHVEQWVEELGENPTEEVGYKVPFPEFQEMYGGLRKGNLYAIVSRAGQGKSTFINEMVFGACRLSNFSISGLCLDTEMFTKDTSLRMISALTGVPFYYIETGLWRKNKEFEEKIRNCWRTMKAEKFKYYHYHVRNKHIDEVVPFCRRWFRKNVPNKEAIIAYDYVKLTSEKLDKNWAEHQAIGEKVDKLKKMGEELLVPVVTAMQLNRSGENHGRKGSDVVDDASAISLSDRLQWFASFVGIFRRKTLDELTEDGLDFGTHKLIPLKTRFQGKSSGGHFDLVKRQDGDKTTYHQNFLNFNVENFEIKEKGSLRDIVAKEEELKNIQKKSSNKGKDDADL